MATYQEWARIIAKAWLDEEFKSLLEGNPAAAFEQSGIKPDTVIRIPPRPDELSDEQLEVIAESGNYTPPPLMMNSAS